VGRLVAQPQPDQNVQEKPQKPDANAEQCG
jgi:hypothetical protein